MTAIQQTAGAPWASALGTSRSRQLTASLATFEFAELACTRLHHFFARGFWRYSTTTRLPTAFGIGSGTAESVIVAKYSANSQFWTSYWPPGLPNILGRLRLSSPCVPSRSSA